MTTTALFPRPLLSPDLVRTVAEHQLLPFRHDDPTAPRRLADRLLADTRYDRPALSRLLLNYNQSLGQDDAALANARRLAQPNALVVVTGQQAGLFTGPLYTLYKAITTVRLAAHYEAELGLPVIPLFWNATEDHDLSEIATSHLPQRSLRAAFPETGLAAEALRTDPAVTDVVERYLADLPEMAWRDELAALLEPDFKDYGLYSSAVMARLFRGTGLVILEPRLLRPLAQDFFARAFAERNAVREALQQGADRLAELGLDAAFAVDHGFGLFHLDEEGRRHRLQERHGRILQHQDWVEPTAIAQLIARDPASFSTAAFLRPVLQSLLLPNLAYVAGPGEYAYHLQLPPVYDHFGAALPMLHPRNHATLLTAREAKLVQRLGLAPADLFTGPHAHYYAEPLPEPDQAAFAEANQDWEALLARLTSGLSTPIDPRRLATTDAKVRELLARLQVKTQRDYLRKAGVDNARIDRLYAVLTPKGQPQERYLGPLYFLQARGPHLVAELLAAFDPFEPHHYVITFAD